MQVVERLQSFAIRRIAQWRFKRFFKSEKGRELMGKIGELLLWLANAGGLLAGKRSQITAVAAALVATLKALNFIEATTADHLLEWLKYIFEWAMANKLSNFAQKWVAANDVNLAVSTANLQANKK